MCVTCNPNYFHHLQQYVAIEKPIRSKTYAVGTANRIFATEINKIEQLKVLVTNESNILITGTSSSLHPPIYIAPRIPPIAEIHPMICLIT